MYCKRTWRSTSQRVFNLVSSSLKQRIVMEMLAKQDCRHYCLWTHHLLEGIMDSGQHFCSIFCKAALSSLVWSEQTYSSSNGYLCFHIIPSLNSWVKLPGWCLWLLILRKITSFQKNHWSPWLLWQPVIKSINKWWLLLGHFFGEQDRCEMVAGHAGG